MADLIDRNFALSTYQDLCDGIACTECKMHYDDCGCLLEEWIEKLPSAEPEIIHKAGRMSDLISRQDAIDAIMSMRVVDKSAAKRILMQLPSVEPERKTGKWIGDKCSVCGVERAWYGCNPKYCPDCGAKMEASEDERFNKQTGGD